VLIALLMGTTWTTHCQEVGQAPDLGKALWIWSPDGGPDGSGPVSYLRRKFTLAARPVEATILVTADNGYELYVNNQRIAAELDFGGTWRTIERFRIESCLTAGANVIAIRGDNLGGPGGVLAGLYVRTADGAELTLLTDKQWLSIVQPKGNWTEPDHDDTLWKPAAELQKYGGPPWGELQVPGRLTDPKSLVVDATIPAGPPPPPPDKFTEPPADARWPAGVVFITGRAPQTSTSLQGAIWPIGGARAFFEYDVPAPAVSGYRLWAMVPATPGTEPCLLLDAGRGLIASPTCSLDGQEIIFALAPQDEKFFHLYRISPDGSGLKALTSGPWHDYDPAVLPDGRLVFASTRIGCREEYHANTARSLFTLSADRAEIRPLTHHIVADTEPAVTADGRIVFVRQDNFMERAKVETNLHCVRPDGTGDEVLMGPDRGKVIGDRPTGAEEDYTWLRAMGFGCPAPLPDGRVACLSYLGLTITGVTPEGADKRALRCDVAPFDLSPLPDGRLLATTLHGVLCVIDPDTGTALKLFDNDAHDAHSVRVLGPRPAPPILSTVARRTGFSLSTESDPRGTGSSLSTSLSTGNLFCQSVYNTKQTDGDWKRVKAIRVVMGNPLTVRPARHQYGHIGTEGVELGSVPLAPDGSFFVRVPADRPLFLQAVDGEGRPVVNELSWIYVRPGETRSCVGCHAPRADAPTGKPALAALRPPVDLLADGRPYRFRANNAANGGVLNQQFDRFREVASIDLYSQPAFAPGADPTALGPGPATERQALTAALKSTDANVRRTSAQRLAILRDRAATAPLADATRDPDAGVRCAAVLALAACGSRDATPALLDALGDHAAEVAQAAGMALEHLTGHVEPFNGYADQATRREQAAAWRAWLESHDWAAIERELVTRVASPDATDCQLAIEALGHIGGEPGKQVLREYLASGRSDSLVARLAAIRALGHLRDEQAIPLLKAVLEQNIGDVPGVPFKSHELGWQAVPDHLAGAAAEALGRIGTPEAEACLMGAFATLRDFWFYTFRTADHSWLMGCHSSIPHYRILEALDAIGSRGTPPLTGALLRSVPMDCDRGLLLENDAYEITVARLVNRSGMAAKVIETALSVLGDPAAKPTPELQAAVTASPPAESVGELSPAARAAQLLSVVVLDPQYGPRIREAFQRIRTQEPSRERSWVCFFLARALGKLRDAGSVPVLRAALDEDQPEADFGIPDPPNVFLHEAMTPCYRAAAADALGRIAAREAYPTLRAAVTDYRNAMDVRQAAARALCRVADPSSLPELEKLADGYPEVVTQMTLWEGCAALAAR
jgi:HEAT repeat protein